MVIGVLLLFWANPPHSICDTEKKTLSESIVGLVTPMKVKNRQFPAKIVQARLNCLEGYDSGSCFEYFGILRKVANDVRSSSLECAKSVYEVPEVKKSLNQGIESLVLMAWGESPPEPGPSRLGWFQESDIGLFCQLKKTFIRSYGQELWEEARRSINQKLPGEPRPQSPQAQRVMAPEKLSENEIWNRSIFSARCELY